MRNFIYVCIITVLLTGCSSKQEMVSVVNDKTGQNIITEQGNTVLQNSFDKVYTYSELYVKIQKDNKVGMANYNGEIILTPSYDSISSMYNGYAVIEVDKKFGLLDNNMKVILEPSLEAIEIKENFFIVKKEGKSYCMNDRFEMFSQPYDYIYYFVEGFARVESDEKFGFINSACQEVLEVKYDYADDFVNGFAKLNHGNNISYVNQEMKIITKETYNDTYFFKGK